jgi:hypothetical protein
MPRARRERSRSRQFARDFEAGVVVTLRERGL